MEIKTLTKSNKHSTSRHIDPLRYECISYIGPVYIVEAVNDTINSSGLSHKEHI